MLNRLRLLPTLMLCALLLLGLKVVDIFSGADELSPISVAHANDAAASDHAAEPAKEADAGDHGAAKPADAHAAPSADAGAVSTERPQEAALPKSEMTKAEIAVLESLVARRDELDKRAKDLDTREQLLAAAERRVEDRIEELKGLEKKINSQISQVDEQTDKQMSGVIKMYETMKPKEAARIFERLDMGVLVDMAKRMDPRKMAVILASMDPVTAQELTVELATGGKLADTKPKAKPSSEFAAPAASAAAPAAAVAPVAMPAPAATLPDAKSAETPPA